MTSAKSNRLVHPRSSNDSFDLCYYLKEDVSHPNNPKRLRLLNRQKMCVYGRD
jgi:hypothetical protein